MFKPNENQLFLLKFAIASDLCRRSSQGTDKTGENTLLQQNTALTKLTQYYSHYLYPLLPDHKRLLQNQNTTINPLVCAHLKSIF